jgi:glycosyltransferase involved in cell wall biosynthesis
MKALFVSYDGALDPLGTSQVVACLVGLAARGCELTLVSFEKATRWNESGPRERLAQRLRGAGVRWRALRYHKRPRVPATLWDFVAGVRAIAGEARRSGARVVHCRGDVSLAMARLALPRSARLLYDARGLFSLERIEVGSWPEGGVLDRLVRGVERGNLNRANAIAVNTEAARAALAARRTSLPPCRIIPSFVDLERFKPREAGVAPEFGLVYSGSLGTWYKTREMIEFARVAARVVPGRPLFLTPDVAVARAAGATPDWAEVVAVPHEEVPAWLRKARAQFFFIEPSPAKRASSPTKLGEGLAAGLPVVANAGVGDLDHILEPEGVGVLVTGFGEGPYQQAAERLMRLVEDPAIGPRCRNVAERRYSLRAAVEAYSDLYNAIGN